MYLHLNACLYTQNKINLGLLFVSMKRGMKEIPLAQDYYFPLANHYKPEHNAESNLPKTLASFWYANT